MAQEELSGQNPKQPSKNQASLVFFVLVIFFGTVVFVYWLFLRGTESTEDAKVAGHIVNVASRINGQVIQVLVNNGTGVKADDPLVVLDSAIPLANVKLARADFDAAVASFKQAVVDVKQARASFLSAQSAKQLEYKNLMRVQSLQKQSAISQQDVDQQKNRYEQAVATFEGAKAVLYMSEHVYQVFGDKVLDTNKDKFLSYSEKMKGLNPTLDLAIAKLKRAHASLVIANANLSYTTVRAPFAGVVTNKTVEVGKNVNSDAPLLSVVSLTDTWVVANFKETQLNGVPVGSEAEIQADAYDGKTFKGVVTSIAAASGDSFALLPPDNASGNFVKVTQRFPVKIEFRPFPKELMRPGMSLEVSVKSR
ncbi:MAG: HlyD family secretion protein [Bdellovibrionota bacterium]